ncbi:MAG TPA: isoprenylcysteine carboxylmethyltransferase family protein, partial [Gammaproteobacteria bacterium]|nr:isoprenylcysteine carboxylmethyltransferase family protein [Gammaproteobacteria bacterium]
AHLFGLQQVYERLRRRPHQDPAFQLRGLYRHVRHPIMLGFVVAFWSAPVMSWGHLLFAAASTGYILVALQFEEHDLITFFGSRYREYRARVPMLIPLPGRAARDTEAPETSTSKVRS